MVPHLKKPMLTIYGTNRCNLTCMYCMRDSVCEKDSEGREIDAAAIKNILAAAKEEGYERVKFSSEWGEPLIRRDIEELVFHAKKLSYMDISLSTNGTLLKGRAESLRKAGLHRLCVSLDTLKPRLFKKITGQDVFADTMAGIDEAVAAFGPAIKVNMVVVNGVNNPEIKGMLRWTTRKGIVLQMIEVVGKEQKKAGMFFDLDPTVSSLSRKSLLVAKDKVEKITTIIGADFKVQMRQSRKWPELFYRNERMVIHPDGEIGFWLRQHTKLYAITKGRADRNSISSQIQKAMSLKMSPSETRYLRQYGNRKCVS